MIIIKHQQQNITAIQTNITNNNHKCTIVFSVRTPYDDSFLNHTNTFTFHISCSKQHDLHDNQNQQKRRGMSRLCANIVNRTRLSNTSHTIVLYCIEWRRQRNIEDTTYIHLFRSYHYILSHTLCQPIWAVLILWWLGICFQVNAKHIVSKSTLCSGTHN